MTIGTLTELTEITAGSWAGGEHPGRRPDRFSGIAVDSRALQPGEVFFCLKGARTDGHHYARAAAKRKAAAIVVRKGRPGFARPIAGVPVLRVADPAEALCTWAGHHRRKFNVCFTAITGSVGKTSTKEMLASIFAQKYPTFKTPGNYNNLLGIPLSLPGLTAQHRLGVVEMGMSSPGEIARLTRMIDPEVGIITWIGPAHLEFFTGMQGIARAKRELFDEMNPAGIGIVNIDNPILARWKKQMKRKILGYSIRRRTDVYATDIRLAPGETVFKLNGRTLVRLPVMGVHAVANALAACAAAGLYGIGVEKIRSGLLHMCLPSGRMAVKKNNSITILDDSYNSNPISAKAALATLGALRPPGKKVACLGAMRELGDSALQLHKDVGRAAAAQGVEVLLGVGYWGRQIVAGAEHARRRIFTHVAPDADKAGIWLAENLSAHDVVLIKASRAEGFDRIVQYLTVKHPGQKRTR
jgi:UDP-N-acetylmuramoyl-tripeptide--D-alanyl-D-alanine ligase